MKQSPIFSYYEKNESKMLENIIKEKNNSPFLHRITSRRLFAKEVEIMTQVIEELNKENVYVGYIYDALFCHPKQADRVKEIMDIVIQNYHVQTTAKLSNSKKHNSIVVQLKEEKLDMHSIANLTQQNDETLACLKIDARDINYCDGIKNKLLERIQNGELLNFVDAEIIFTEDYILRERVLEIYDMLNSSAPYVLESFILDSEI